MKNKEEELPQIEEISEQHPKEGSCNPYCFPCDPCAPCRPGGCSPDDQCGVR